MNLQSIIDGMSKSAEMERSRYHLTLGKLIERLKQSTGDMTVAFDLGGYPCEPHSYRGYYSDLAFEKGAEPISVTEFINVCEAALGNTYEGYKGGDFTMTEKTPLWCAVYGNCGPAIIDIHDKDNLIVLVTKEVD